MKDCRKCKWMAVYFSDIHGNVQICVGDGWDDNEDGSFNLVEVLIWRNQRERKTMRLISLILVLMTATLAVIFQFLTHRQSTLPIRPTQRVLVSVLGTDLIVTLAAMWDITMPRINTVTLVMQILQQIKSATMKVILKARLSLQQPLIIPTIIMSRERG